MMEDGIYWMKLNRCFPIRHLNALQTVGYTELFDYLQGKSGLEESLSLIKQNTRHMPNVRLPG